MPSFTRPQCHDSKQQLLRKRQRHHADTVDAEELLDARVSRTLVLLQEWENTHESELREQEQNAEQAVSDHEIDFLLEQVVPDGGFGWLVVLSCWISNGITNSVSFVYGLLLAGIVDSADCFNGTAANCQPAEVSESLLTSIGTVHCLMLYLLSPIIMASAIRVRQQTLLSLIGAAMASLGLLLCSLVDYGRHSAFLLLHFGILTSIGLAIQLTVQSIVLNHYFKRKLTIAAGICTSGFGLYSAIFSEIVNWINVNYSVRCSFLFLSLMAASGLVYTQVWRQNRDFQLLQKWVRTPKPLLADIVNTSVLRKPSYALLFMAMLLTYCGALFPWMVMVQYARKSFDATQMTAISRIYTARGVANGFLRATFGTVLSCSIFRRHQICLLPIFFSFYLMGVLTEIAAIELKLFSLLYASSQLTAIGESLIASQLPGIVAALTNSADAPAGLVLINVAVGISLLAGPIPLSMISSSFGYFHSHVACAALIACGFVCSLLILYTRPPTVALDLEGDEPVDADSVIEADAPPPSSSAAAAAAEPAAITIGATATAAAVVAAAADGSSSMKAGRYIPIGSLSTMSSVVAMPAPAHSLVIAGTQLPGGGSTGAAGASTVGSLASVSVAASVTFPSSSFQAVRINKSFATSISSIALAASRQSYSTAFGAAKGASVTQQQQQTSMSSRVLRLRAYRAVQHQHTERNVMEEHFS